MSLYGVIADALAPPKSGSALHWPANDRMQLLAGAGFTGEVAAAVAQAQPAKVVESGRLPRPGLYFGGLLSALAGIA